jgi:HSP20 family protein
MLALRKPRFPMLRSMAPLWADFLPEKRQEMLWSPRVDIERENGSYVLTAEFPGVDKEDVHVDVKDGMLTIRGEKKNEVTEEKDGYRYSERVYGSFERSFRLSDKISSDDIQAKLEKGVLTVTIPAPEEEAKKIEVKAD